MGPPPRARGSGAAPSRSGSLPDGPGALGRGLTRGALAATILLFGPGLLDPFDPLKAIAIRVLGLGALAVGLVAWTPRPEVLAGAPRRRVSAMDLAVVLWVAAALLSTAFGVAPRLSVFGELQPRDGLLTTLGLAGVYLAARSSHVQARHARVTLHVVLVAAAIAAVYAHLQLAERDPLAWANLSRYAADGGSVLRPFATLGNPILLGAVLAPALGIATARVATAAGTPAGWVMLSALLSTAVLATLSRGAWLAGAAAATAALVAAAVDRRTRSARRALLALGAAGIPAALLGVWMLRAPVVARMTESASAAGGSIPLRREIAAGAVALWRMRPWLGTGPGSFALMFPRVQTPAYGGGLWAGLPAQAHSVALHTVATIGIVGAGAGLVWLGALLASARVRPAADDARRERIAIGAGIAALLVLGVVDDVGPAGAALFVALSALWVPRDEAPARASADPPRAALAAGLAVALALAIGAIPEVRALAAAARARDALQESLGATGAARTALEARAVEGAEHAVSLSPRCDELWRLACNARLARGRAAQRSGDRAIAAAAAERAERAARRAVALEPLRAGNHDGLGNALALRAQVAAGTDDAAARSLAAASAAAFTEARRLAPVDARILIDEARAALELGAPERARGSAARLVELYPEAAAGHALLGGAESMLGHPDAAAASLRAALGGRWLDEGGNERLAAVRYLRWLDSTSAAGRSATR